MRNLLIIIAAFIALLGYSQDTLYKRNNNNIIVAKVFEISTTEIKYKRFEMPDGPTFIVDKNDIAKIKYQTGIIESFSEYVPKQNFSQSTSLNSNSEFIENYNNRGAYLYNSRKIGIIKTFQVIEAKNNTWNDKEIRTLIAESKKQKAYQYISGFSGIGVGAATFMGMMIASSNAYNYQNQANNVLGVAAVGTLVVIGTQILSKNCKAMHLRYANKAVDAYNKNILNR